MPHKLPAGGALAVDRVGFSDAVTAAVRAHPNITVEFGEIAGLPPADWDNVIVATGPLTSRPLAEAIQSLTGEDELAFFDAIAPIIHGESIDRDIVWAQSRYDKVGPGGTGADYLNCPMDEAQYNAFVDALLSGEKHVYHQWENVPYFDGCLPVEVMAERGRETLALRPAEARGADQSAQSDGQALCHRPAAAGQCAGHAVEHGRLSDQAQIRQPGRNLPHDPRAGERAVRTARRAAPQHFSQFPQGPGPAAAAEGACRACALPDRSPASRDMSKAPRSAWSPGAWLPPRRAARPLRRRRQTTALGALFDHILGGHIAAEGEPGPRAFQPMNVNFGLLPPLEVKKPEGVKRWRGPEKAMAKRKAMSDRALADIAGWA